MASPPAQGVHSHLEKSSQSHKIGRRRRRRRNTIALLLSFELSYLYPPLFLEHEDDGSERHNTKEKDRGGGSRRGELSQRGISGLLSLSLRLSGSLSGRTGSSSGTYRDTPSEIQISTVTFSSTRLHSYLSSSSLLTRRKDSICHDDSLQRRSTTSKTNQRDSVACIRSVGAVGSRHSDNAVVVNGAEVERIDTSRKRDVWRVRL